MPMPAPATSTSPSSARREAASSPRPQDHSQDPPPGFVIDLKKVATVLGLVGGIDLP